MWNSVEKTLAILERVEWFAARLVRDCEAAQAELQNLAMVAPEEAECCTRRLVTLLKQQLRELLQEL